jgi:hypothetical protein
MTRLSMHGLLFLLLPSCAAGSSDPMFPSPAANVPPPNAAAADSDPLARHLKIDAATVGWSLGLSSAEVERQLGLPDYASIESRGGAKDVKEWTARVCRYTCEISRDSTERAYFEVTYHQNGDGTWGLNGWEWKREWVR